MKRFITLMVIAVIAVGMLAMTSCKSSVFGIQAEMEKVMTINAENAAVDAESTAGGLEVADGEQIVITSALESGSINVEIFTGSAEESSEEVAEPEGEPVMTFNANGTDMQSGTVDAGYYTVRATVTEKATGMVQIEVLPTEPEQWNSADSPDDAGEKAGLGLFLIDPSGLSLGPVTDAEFRYMEGVAEAHFGVAAVELYIRKGLASIDEGDISFDNNEYKYEWTKEIDGTEIKCFGNREGEATKSIWVNGDYSYAILAYGAGGDDDFGLSEEDLASLFANMQ